mgnify:CR=1 FL=1
MAHLIGQVTGVCIENADHLCCAKIIEREFQATGSSWQVVQRQACE